MSISILILTLNEEMNLPLCLASVKWSDDIVVLDSFSSDQTCSIAKDSGARVIQRHFDNWSSHYNWALEKIDFKHSWIFYLDADERMTENLRDELLAIARGRNNTQVAYYCGRKNYFMGKWIKHAMPPGHILRFFRPRYVRFERLVNPIPIINGRHGYLKNYIEHYNFSKGLAAWFNKHNEYSTLEAMEGRKALLHGSFNASSLFSIDRLVRRRALKKLAVVLPLRSVLKFVYLYFLKLGFLDGQPGLRYCFLQSIYEYMTVLKIDELKRRERHLPV